MEISEYLESRGINTAGTENEHVSPGWIGIDCPFCGEKEQFHMGINISGGGCRCWRCGKHKLTDVLKALNIKPRDFFSNVDLRTKTPPKAVEHPSTVKFPAGCSPALWKAHKEFMKKRMFDPESYSKHYQLRATGPTGGKYKWRIVIPVIKDGKIVSWTARDVTGKSDQTYMSPPKEWEVEEIKHCLYGYDDAKNYNRVIVVEGPTDVWRMGKGTVATFGSAWTGPQAALLSRWKAVFIMYDMEDEEAIEKGRDLARALDLAGTRAETVQPKGMEAGDPGSLKVSSVRKIREQLGMEV